MLPNWSLRRHPPLGSVECKYCCSSAVRANVTKRWESGDIGTVRGGNGTTCTLVSTRSDAVHAGSPNARPPSRIVSSGFSPSAWAGVARRIAAESCTNSCGFSGRRDKTDRPTYETTTTATATAVMIQSKRRVVTARGNERSTPRREPCASVIDLRTQLISAGVGHNAIRLAEHVDRRPVDRDRLVAVPDTITAKVVAVQRVEDIE